jgi:hypothetical protein
LPLTLERLQEPNRFMEILGSVPAKLEQVIQCPPISALVNAGAPKSSLEAVLAIEITKAANMLTVGGNLRQGQSLEIARDLIAQYPNESLEDFCYCLRNGVRGKYSESGKLFRFDSVVINEWFAKFLEEKYEAIENRLMDEKDNHYNAYRKDTDWLQLMQDALKETDSPGINGVPKLTDAEIKAEGQAKPKKPTYPSTSKSEIEQRLLHLEYLKANYDARTGEPLPNWMEERLWLEQNKVK